MPKDTAELADTAARCGRGLTLLKSVIESNEARTDAIADRVLALRPHRVGVYGTAMKAHSDNSRCSSTLTLVDRLMKDGLGIVVYERLTNDVGLAANHSSSVKFTNSVDDLVASVDVIVANRTDGFLTAKAISTGVPVITADVFGGDS